MLSNHNQPLSIRQFVSSLFFSMPRSRRRLLNRNRSENLSAVESLEDRTLLVSPSVSVTLDGNILKICGTSSADEVTVSYNHDQSEVLVSVGGSVTNMYTSSSVASIDFRGKGGDDTFKNETGKTSKALGGAGKDTLEGGSGMDTLLGNSGEDIIRGRGGNDELRGGADNDLLVGGEGNDFLFGSTGDDDLQGGGGVDDLLGGSGDDNLDGGGGNDELRGGGGNDFLQGGENDDNLWGNTGNDTLRGNAGNDDIWGNSGNDTLKGENGNDTLEGGSGNDILLGGDGDDTLKGRTGNDVLIGGTGNDTLLKGNGAMDYVFNNTFPPLENGATHHPSAPAYVDNGHLLVQGTNSRDIIYVKQSGINIQVRFGGSGGNTWNFFGPSVKKIFVAAEGGNDSINIRNSISQDTYSIGGAGNDVIRSWSTGHNFVLGGKGSDTLYGGSGNSHLFGGPAKYKDSFRNVKQGDHTFKRSINRNDLRRILGQQTFYILRLTSYILANVEGAYTLQPPVDPHYALTGILNQLNGKAPASFLHVVPRLGEVAPDGLPEEF